MLVQGAQTHQVSVHMENDLYDTIGTDNQSSCVSSSGIKSILSNAWNAIKSAFSNVLSAFGSHLCGQQGSDKPGRDIAMDESPRPAQPLPDMDAQLENTVYESCNENIYESIYSEIEDSLYEETGEGQAPPPLNFSTHPSLSGSSESIYSEIEDSLYEETGKGQAQTPLNFSTHPSLSRLYGSETKSEVMDTDDDTYSLPHDNLKAGSEAESEAFYQIGKSIEEDYAVPQDVLKAGSTPQHDPRGDGDYDDPAELEFNPEHLLQRMISDRLKAQ